MTKDLTTGSPIKSILTFGTPIILGNVFQRLYNMVDSIIVSHFVGFEQLGAVGSTGSLNFMVLGFVSGMCTGCSINIAQAFGAGEHSKVKKYFINSIILGFVVALLLTILTLVFLDNILMLMNTPESSFLDAKIYIGTIFAGIVGMFLYGLLAAVLQALGDSKTPLFFLILSSVMNVILSLLFVAVLQMEVFGAALGTVIAQTFSGICCIVLIMKKFEILKFKVHEFKSDFGIIKKLFGTGLPMGLQFSITAVGGVILQASVNTLGPVVLAAVSSASRIYLIFNQFMEGIGIACANFAGQNTGAKQFGRIKKGVRDSLIVTYIYSVVCFVFMYFCGPMLALIFVTPDNTEAIETMHLLLLLNVGGFIFLSTLLVLRNVIQGMGRTKVAMIAGICEMFARIAASALVIWFGVVGAGLSNPCAWVSATVFLIGTYIVVMRKAEKQELKPNE